MRVSNGFNLQINKSGYSYMLSFFAGVSLVFAYAPFSLWPISLLALLLWLSQLDQRSPKQAFYQGLCFGFGWFSAGISWVHVSIDQFGGMPLIVSILMMILLCVYLALYPALAAWLAARLSWKKSVNLYFLPFIWLFSEYLRAHMLTGFPWLSLGYSQIDGPLSSLAPIIGEVGITFVLICFVVAAYKLMQQKQRRLNQITLLAIITLITISANTNTIKETGETVNVALVQGNIKQELRWDEAQEQSIINSYIQDSKNLYQSHDLVIWPEAAIPKLEPLAQEYLQQLDEQAFTHNSALITGIINYDPNTRHFFNRLVMLGKKQDDDSTGDYYYRNSNHYDKHHLLPIGEFVPFADLLRPIAPFFNLPMSSFSRGDYVQKNLVANNLRIAPLICFEIVFPKQLAANMTNETDLLLTVSNDAWFGDSHGPHQHLEIARMRALEFGRPMLRSTNNGITAVINHKGMITADIPQFTKVTLSTKVVLVSGTTFYSQYALHLDKLLFLIFLLILIWHKFSINKLNKSL